MLRDAFVGLCNGGCISCANCNIMLCSSLKLLISVLSSKCNASSGSSIVLLPLNISVLHFQLFINVIPLLYCASVRRFSVSFQIILNLGQLSGCPKVKTVFRIFCQVRFL